MTIIPNHFGLKHPWFTEKPEFYIQKPAEEVAQSVWKTADGTGSAWATLEGNDTIKYLQQFSRNVDLDFRNKDVVSEMRVTQHTVNLKLTSSIGFKLQV